VDARGTDPAGPPPWRLRCAEDGVRLDVFLVAALASQAVSRALVQRSIRAGLVRVEGRAARPGERLSRGSTVCVDGLADHGPTPLGPEEIPLHVVFEDDDVAVVDKPAGLVVHPAPGHWTGTLVQALLARYGSLEGVAPAAMAPPEGHAGGQGLEQVRPGIVHRLDRDTSGLLLVARSRRAGLELRRQLAAREVHRVYLAIAHGTPPERFSIDAPIARAQDGRRMELAAHGRPARTRAHLREPLVGPPPCALLEVQLDTGRTHQIRVHLAAAGHPLVGDRVYGRGGEEEAALAQPLPGQALHAWRLRFRHPVDGREIALEAAPPPAFQAVLQRLRGTAPSP
jgi:23S rRNA pseudouridine1911/1915/1917 synthase